MGETARSKRLHYFRYFIMTKDLVPMTRVIFRYSEPANEYYIVTFMGLDYNIHGWDR
jgi:hypothetical protein